MENKWLVVVNSGLRSSTYEQTMDNLWIIYGKSMEMVDIPSLNSG